MIMIVWLVAILVLAAAAVVVINSLQNNQDEILVRATMLAEKNLELTATINRIELTVREHYDLSPAMSDVVLDDINSYRRKELGQ